MRILGIAPYLIAAICVVAFANYGVSRSLGAHPFWAEKTALIGTPIGLTAAFLVRSMAWTRRVGLFVILLVITTTAAHQGRLVFAASFAENRLAGQFWYFGWIGIAAALAALIATTLTPRRIFR